MQGFLSDKEIAKMHEDMNNALDENHEYTYEQFVKDYSGNQMGDMNMQTDWTKIQLDFVNKSKNQDPEFATAGSSGFDLRADLIEPMTLKSGERAIVPTGLFFEIPQNFEIQVRPRSGLAAKHGITVLNTPGTIDADYRGEIKVILINHGENDFVIENGERIAQAVLATVTAKNVVNLNSVESIDENTERGVGGFGSTGTK